MTGRRSSVMRFAAPAVLLLLVGASTMTVAQAATVPAPDLAPLVEAQVDGPDGAEPLLATGPTPDPAASVPKIEVVFPPPPPPPAPVSTGTRRGTSSGGGSSSGGGGGAATGPLLDATNSVRAQNGVGALSWSSSLASGASNYAWTMCNAQDSTGYAFGSDEWYASVFKHAGGVAENIYAAGSANEKNLSSAHSNWVASSDHFRNMIKASHTTFGVGSCTSASGVFFAVERFR